MVKDRTSKNPSIGTAQIKLLERLCRACGVSGNERAVREIVVEEVKTLADTFTVDALGNVLVTRYGFTSGPRPRVMLAAHMDEVGFMIAKDHGEGIYQFETVGGINTTYLAGKPVVVGKDLIPGVIGAKPIHLTTSAERSTALKKDALRIDTGPGGDKVKPGTWAYFAPHFTAIGRGAGRTLRTKALDDRVGVATLIELVKNPPPNIDLLAAFTVQEEIGLRGAKVAAHAMKPDLAIALDCTPAYDLPPYDPDEENTRYNTRLGFGPALYVSDGRTLGDPRLLRHFSASGDTNKIPYQYRQPGGGGTDAGAIHKALTGIPSISISVPGRYLHTPVSMIRLSDWRNSVKLIDLGLRALDADLFKSERH